MGQQQTLNVLKYSKRKSNTAILMLHGYGANNEDLYSLAPYLDVEGKFDWYFPNGPVEVPINWWMTGRAWFPIDLEAMQQAQMTGTWRDLASSKPDHLEESLEMLNRWLSSVIGEYDTLIIGGFSQGAMMASHYFARYPSHISKLIFLSGALIDREGLGAHLDKNRPNLIPIFQSHGKQDTILGIHQGEELSELFRSHGFSIDLHYFEGGHEIPESILGLLRRFLVR